MNLMNEWDELMRWMIYKNDKINKLDEWMIQMNEMNDWDKNMRLMNDMN